MMLPNTYPHMHVNTLISVANKNIKAVIKLHPKEQKNVSTVIINMLADYINTANAKVVKVTPVIIK